MITDLNYNFLLFQLLNVTVLFTWAILAVRALRQLHATRLSETANLIWAFLIVTIPVLGALAFLMVYPKQTRLTAK